MNNIKIFFIGRVIKMAKGSIPRRKCLEYATGLAMLQIALTFAVIWFYQKQTVESTIASSNGKVNKEVAVFSSNSDSDSSRLLLSVEYNSIGAKQPSNNILPHPQLVRKI